MNGKVLPANPELEVRRAIGVQRKLNLWIGQSSPTDFEYDFERYELFEHRVTFSEAVECFYKDFQIR
jgi:hypothetical protein